MAAYISFLTVHGEFPRGECGLPELACELVFRPARGRPVLCRSAVPAPLKSTQLRTHNLTAV